MAGRFLGPPDEVDFFSSGCMVLDMVMGGGYPERRITNIVGDKSTGKTLLAIEAMINFLRKHHDGDVYYMEAESAFDWSYAEKMGLKKGTVTMIQKDTVEDMFEALQEVTERRRFQEPPPALFIVDSLDALTDRSEVQRKLDEATYGGDKPKKLSQAFRRMIRYLTEAHTTLLIISQIRDNIGVTFGRKYKRSGGHALDFYASVVLYLAEVGKRHKTLAGLKRTIGVDIKAKTDKNKVGLPFRECQFPIVFGYGIEDVEANLLYLEQSGRLEAAKEALESKGVKLTGKSVTLMASKIIPDKQARKVLGRITRKAWQEVEVEFSPTETKYI
jgi:recombination protein RecA